MRSPTTRRVLAGSLLLVGLALLTWSASAALGFRDEARDLASDAAARPDAAPADARTSLAATLSTPLGDTARSVDLPALPHLGLLPAKHEVDSGELPLGARVNVALATTSAAGAPASTAAQGARLAEHRLILTPGASAALAASAFTLAGLAAYFWGALKTGGTKLLLLPAIGLYARVTRAEVFDNGVRERIFGAIRATPGLSTSDLAKAAGVSWGTTIYHLDVLEQNRMVTSMRHGRHRRYFENGAALAVPKEAVGVLQNVRTARIAASIQAAPGASQKDLAARVGLSPQALHWHLRRLVETGLVRKVREGRVVRHFTQ